MSKRAELLKRSIMDGCKICSGLGCADCAVKVEAINLYELANIPATYFDLSTSTFPGDPAFLISLAPYLNSKDFYLAGRSICFAGRHGIGKTFGATQILKKAVLSGFTAYYTTMNEIVDTAVSKNPSRYEYKNYLTTADIVCIDEVDSRFMPQSESGRDLFGSSLEVVIRTRQQNRLPIIFCTNNTDLDIFGNSFEATFKSLMATVKMIYVGGKDMRRIKGIN